MSSLFWKKVAKIEGGCWIWTGPMDRNGYGLDGGARKTLAHRVAYRELVGEIAPGLELDHLCRVRHCVRPDHLQPVTHRENMLRGNGWAGKNARKTHCPHGHEYTPDNTKLRNGSRTCRACRSAKNAEKLRRRRARLRERRLATGWVPWARVAKKVDPG